MCQDYRDERTRAQCELMSAGLPTDPCGSCGCMRKSHLPDESYTAFRAYRNMGKYQPPPIKILAFTACSKCPYCICFCTKFQEPKDGQEYIRCFYQH